MKVFKKKVSDLEGVGRTHDLFKFSSPKIPFESNCPFMVVTDTLNCQKEVEGLVDLDEVRGTGRCSFWPPKDQETKGKVRNLRSSWADS